MLFEFHSEKSFVVASINCVSARHAGPERGNLALQGAIQTFGDLICWHKAVPVIVCEGMSKRDGFFIRIVRVHTERCTEAWWERVFDLPLSF